MISKYYHTLKYLKPVQIYGRIYSKLKKPFSIYNLPEFNLTPVGITNKTAFITHDFRNSSEKIENNEFTFLNQSNSFGNKINWHDKSLPLLWMFNLHYFGYLHLLNNSQKATLINDWITNNSLGSAPGWHPYPLSLRIVNWTKSNIKDEGFNKSLYQQCAYLYRNLEFYHPANHYLENAKALIFGGLYFKDEPNALKWFKKGILIYKNKLPEMVLEDGCFFELSPMYHSIILEGILDILNICETTTEEYNFFKSYAEKMIGFLQSITHPDGELVLFNDSTLEIAPSPEEISKYAAQLGVSVKFNRYSGKNGSGLFSFANKDIFIVIDGGRIGPDNIPAHSHADIFTYELSFKGKKFIVDSGVFQYTAGEMRDYCRSTRAHNTVTIDGISQAEMWGSFRVARRYEPFDIKSDEDGDRFSFEGKFGGYSELIGDNLIHHREIEFEKKTSSLIVVDSITGSGNHKIESYIHLHPDVKLTEFEDYLVLSRENVTIKLSVVNSQFSIDNGWYCPEFGKRIKNKVISIYSNQLPVKLTYKIFE